MDPQALSDNLCLLDDATVVAIFAQVIQNKPMLAPDLCKMMIPDYTYAPAAAMTAKRATGILEVIDLQAGYGLLTCPELQPIFGCDVYVHKDQIGSITKGQEVTFATLLNDEYKPQAYDLQATGSICGAMGSSIGGACIGGASGAVGGTVIGGVTPDLRGMSMGGIADTSGMDSGVGMGGDMGDTGVGPGSRLGVGSGMGGIMNCATNQLAKGNKGNGKQKGKQQQEVLGQFTGVVKNLSRDKGYGFVACPDLNAQGYQGDVYLHHQQFKDFAVGAQVSFTAFLHNGRPQARDLEDAGGQEAAAEILVPQGKGAEIGVPQGKGGTGGAGDAVLPAGLNETVLGTYHGQIKSFNVEKKFGFIVCPDLAEHGPGDVYLHGKHIANFSVGDHVLFTAYLFKGRLQCRELRLPDTNGVEEPDLKKSRLV